MKVSLKDYRIKIVSFVLISLIVYSSIATINIDSQAQSLQTRLQKLAEESDDILSDVQENVQNDLNQQISPSEVSMPLSPEEFSDISRILEKTLYDSWIASPEYSFSKETIKGWEVTQEKSPEKASLLLKTNLQGTEYSEETIYSQKPAIRVFDFKDSLFTNISVPVLAKTEMPEDFVPEYTTTTHRVMFGFRLPSVHIDKTIRYKIPLVEKFKAWFKFDMKINLYFPVDLEITHPTRVFEGQEYEYSCKVIPLNIDGNEYEFTFKMRYGYKKWKWRVWSKCKKYKRTPILKIRYCAKRKWYAGWKLRSSYSKSRGFSEKKSFTTPLGGDKISFTLPEVKVGGLGGSWGDLISFYVSLGETDLYGESITGFMITSPNLWNSRLISWNEADQTASTSFTILSHKLISNLEFSITGLTYWLKRMVFHPYIKVKFEGLLSWIGSKKYYLPEFDISAPLPIFTNDLFKSSGVSVTEDYSAIYDFDMTVTKVQDLAPSPYGPFQQFEIDLTNSNLNPDQSDTIELEVSGLPKGFRYEFDLDPALYKLSGSDVADPGSFTIEYGGDLPGETEGASFSSIIEPNTNPFGVAGQSTARLNIYGPEYTDAPPGDWSFDITATSLQSVHYELPDSSITQTAVLTVPEIHGVDLEFASYLLDGMVINHGDNVSIDFSGQNLGNMNDVINVTAQLNTGMVNHTWSEEFNVDPYGSEPNDHILSSFTFVFDKSDVFPSPGLYDFEVTANSSLTPFVDKQLSLTLNFSEAYDVEATISPTNTTVFANWETNFTLSINNTGNSNDTFTIESTVWDYYLIYPSRIVNVTSMEQQEVIITLRIPDPDFITPDTYNFGIIVTSEKSGAQLVFSACEVAITILRPDRVAPAITLREPFYRDDMYIYPESPLTHNFTWQAVDDYPRFYTVFINDTEYDTRSWTNATLVDVPVTGTNPLAVGVYNITIAFNDSSDNIATDQIWLEIVPQDVDNPIIDYLPGKEIFPVNYYTNIEIYWECSEDFIYTLTLYRNGLPIPLTYLDNFCFKWNVDDPRNWTMKHIIVPGTLVEGIWNFTMVLQDMSNNIAKSTVFITITPIDVTDPNLLALPSASSLLGYGNTISATANDTNPWYYELKMDNTTLLHTGDWLNTNPISVNVDTLAISVGPHELFFNVYDLAGNLYSHQWTFTLVDVDPPEMIIGPASQITIFEHNYTKLELPYWSIMDLDSRPGTYEILRDGISIATGVWVENNGTFDLPWAGLDPGVYVYDAYFRDATGNSLYSSIEVTMLDIIKPLIMSIGRLQYEPLYSPNWFEFLVNELHPSQYRLYRNNTLIEDEPLITGDPYVFVSLLGLSTGIYEFTLVVEDESANVGEISIIVKVTDFTPPLIIQPNDLIISEGTSGHLLRWFILEANPNNYSIYVDGTLRSSGTLITTNLSVSLDDLTLGTHAFVLVVYDQFGLSHTCTSYVSLVDITTPTLTHISDCRFVSGDPDIKLTWSAFDLHPANYEFKRNEDSLGQFSWDGSDIVLHLVGWPAGNHTLYLEVRDSSGNIATDELLINLVLEEKILTEPSVDTPGFRLVLVGLAVIFLINFKTTKRKKK